MKLYQMGIRARMVALIAAAVLPFAALIATGVITSYDEADRNARQTIAYEAKLGASRFSRVFLDAKVLLGTVRVMPPLQADDRSRCDGFLKRALENAPLFVTMGVFDRDGMLVCHSNVSDRRAFGDKVLVKRSMDSQSDDLTVGSFMVGPVSKKPTIAVAMKLPDNGKGSELFVFGSLNFDAFERLAQEIAGPTSHTVALLDTASQRVLVRWPNIVAFGTQFPNNPLFAAVSTGLSGGTTFGVGFDNMHRFFGYAPLMDAKGSGLTLLLGLPEDEAFGSIRAQSYWAFGLSVAAFIAATVLAAAIAYWAQLRPILRLMSYAERIGDGDFSHGVPMETWQAIEFRRFAATLDQTSFKLSTAHAAEQKIADSERRFRLVAENTGDMISAIDNDLRRVFVSGASRDIIGYEPHELMGESPIGLVVDEDVDRVSGLLDRMRETHHVQDERYRVRRRDGTVIWVEVSGRKMDDDSGFVFTMRNISKRKAVEDELEKANTRLSVLAKTDGLTQLNNRREFDRALKQEILRSRREQTELSLLLIDVDRFKVFNDHFGHPAGDQCLRQVAAVIANSVKRPGDVCARYGGEEFAVILPNTSKEGARQHADAIRLAVEALRIPHPKSEKTLVTISIGVAGADAGSAIDADHLLQKADDGLYKAKEKGRNRVEIARDSEASLELINLAAKRKR